MVSSVLPIQSFVTPSIVLALFQSSASNQAALNHQYGLGVGLNLKVKKSYRHRFQSDHNDVVESHRHQVIALSNSPHLPIVTKSLQLDRSGLIQSNRVAISGCLSIRPSGSIRSYRSCMPYAHSYRSCIFLCSRGRGRESSSNQNRN
jgi:hypothetical protein